MKDELHHADMSPDLAQRIALVEQKRDQLRLEGYAAVLDAEIIKAQSGKDDDRIQVPVTDGRTATTTRAHYIRDLEARARNCYAAAGRLQEILEKLRHDPPLPAEENYLNG